MSSLSSIECYSDFNYFFSFGSHPLMLRNYSKWCSGNLRDKIWFGHIFCKAGALLTILLVSQFQPYILIYKIVSLLMATICVQCKFLGNRTSLLSLVKLLNPSSCLGVVVSHVYAVLNNFLLNE